MDFQALYDQAVALHQRGALEQAERLYTRLLEAAPGNFAVRHYLGVMRAQQGRSEEALALIGAALQAKPDVPEILLNYGNVLKGVGRRDEALAHYDKALSIQPGYADALFNRGNVLRELGHTDAAVESYDRLLKLQPRHAGALVNRGNVLHQAGRYQEALASFDRAFAAGAPTVEMLKNRGITLRVLCRFAAALADFDRALALAPGNVELMNYRGHVLCESNRVEEGFAMFRQAARQAVASGMAAPADAPAHRARHDAEQQAWLGNRARVDGPLFLDGGERLAGPAINSANAAGVSAQWRTATPQLVVIDGLLAPDALAALRRFCLGSNVWRQSYSDGYLGALPEHGFAAPLLAQIAEELATTYPAIFAGHALRYLWAFKYDSELRGIKIHADEAAVNVNFWITPDDANRDPAHGGLVVWDKSAPLDWDFDKFNGDVEAPRRFLAQTGAAAVTVPYRANRAVVFDSDLFHETDTIDFRAGYENRRINVTLLYGRRARG